MTQTRPTGEQLRFRSQYTGDHVLDDYLEAAEKGGRSLADLLDDIFDASGVFRDDNFQFRYDTTTDALQYRVGQFADPNDGWNTIVSMLKDAGTFINSTEYDNLQLVKVSTDDIYLVHTLSAPQTFANEAAFIGSANTTLLIDVSQVTAAAAAALASESAAATSETNAATSETNAATSETNAATSETNAGTSETNAAASAATASTHKDDAETAKTAAEAAQGAAEAVLDSFDDRYLGAKTSDPALDNDGNALVPGALYWNTTAGNLRFYTGSAWDIYGAGTMAIQSANAVAITGGTITGITDLAIADGGTGSSTAAAARVALGSEIGVNVQAYSANLTTFASNPLTAAELTQLQAINSVTISNAQWGYLGALDQALATTDTPTFATVTSSEHVEVGKWINGNFSGSFYVRHTVAGELLAIGVKSSGGSLYYPINMNAADGLTKFSNDTAEVFRMDSSGDLTWYNAGATVGMT